jgi:hypothetical protein
MSIAYITNLDGITTSEMFIDDRPRNQWLTELALRTQVTEKDFPNETIS